MDTDENDPSIIVKDRKNSNCTWNKMQYDWMISKYVC